MASKELKEVVIASNEIVLHILKGIKQNEYQDFSDFFSSFTGDADLQDKLLAAYDGIHKVPEEIRSFSLFRELDLIRLQISYVSQIVALLQAPKAAHAPAAVAQEKKPEEASAPKA